MRYLRGGPLPILLAVLVTLFVGLSANRIVHEASRATGHSTYHSPDSPPSWIGIDTPSAWRTGSDEYEREEEGTRTEPLELLIVEKEEVVFKGEHERMRDEKMEEVVKRFG